MRDRDRKLIDQIERDALDTKVPVADTLRKLVALGGRAGSSELREWASLELHGYRGKGAEIPDYRRPSAVMLVNAIVGFNQITGQQISPRDLPDPMSEHLSEEVHLSYAIGEIEAMVESARSSGGHLNLTLPGAQEIAALMNHEVDVPYQQITAIYWSVGESALQGVVDRVRTVLVELVAEMRAGTPDAEETPSAAVADQAVNVVIRGLGARVSVNSAQAAGSAVTELCVAPPTSEPGRPWRRVGTVIVGFATIVGTIGALAQWQGWSF